VDKFADKFNTTFQLGIVATLIAFLVFMYEGSKDAVVLLPLLVLVAFFFPFLMFKEERKSKPE
jgi:heme/copper-type cytochrome/quinol oxidase subunit 4